MLSILRKTIASSAKSSRSAPTDHSAVDVDVDELSAWEFVDACLSDDEDLYSFDTDESESKSEGEDKDEYTCDSRESEPPDAVMLLRSLSVSPPTTFPVEVTHHHALDDRDDEVVEEEEEEEEEDVYVDEVDDELVPWKLKDRFGKQRIRKLGKRGGPKLNKSKRLPYYHNRPGCLYGKHGLGVQHSYI